MRIAIPLWEEKISPVLDAATRLLIVHWSESQDKTAYDTHLFEKDICHRARIITDLGIDVLICGAVSRPLEAMLASSGIEVFCGFSGPVAEVLEAFFKGRLQDSGFLMPGFNGPARGSVENEPTDLNNERIEEKIE